MKKEDIRHIADIAMLEFTEEELDNFCDSFSESMDIVDCIKKWDTEEMEGTFQVNKMENHLREDEIVPSLTQEEATKNAKTEKYGYFEIIKFVD
ncbi:Asp-tRNA(Asn)/Glu-tRNA(Gln) amidotransferase subunit GatC [Peptoniphilus sp. KCTC 25270]|uniref:Asp-tRNA(Asn)/Glu-tRNA(Gln) amidotransferase subunit GatC n=1 Tax=Peptoniphilus sp. KCTC 25270 TaxID=2897414 RepID=UPI001E40F368|nr:Asp-tRNA(Asn)/Glu-tRNA(Gln) amidotransferase subunit GatC [Peptoniphilus sp. KCTC 25270]MCD1147216.1 Asp-tRNA(Asn)/Glu-tRNA(Gln) amidotransferase subunit GatC [Peptoniphilus sp. KCTC 25270]